MKIANILVPTDFGASSERALELAVDLAGKFHANLTLMHSFETPTYAYAGFGPTTTDYLVPIEGSVRECLEKALRDLKVTMPSSVALFKRGAPWHQILLACKESEFDLVVMGTHGRQWLAHALLGSVAEKVVRLSPVPVLTVREVQPAK